MHSVVATATIRDTVANLRAFVASNIASGTRHLIVVLDEDQPEAESALAALGCVSVVRADSLWWQADRPARLNVRQLINANAAHAALRDVAGVGWIAHLDGDETLQLPRDGLAGVPDSHAVVEFTTREVVADRSGQRHDRFKRQLRSDELRLLRELGAIPKASNAAYFRGHTAGKVAVRREFDGWIGIHTAKTADMLRADAYRDPEQLVVLHRESVSPEEFVRKWRALLDSGPMAVHRGRRKRLATSMAALLALDLGDDALDRVLREVYDRQVADPVELLDSLGLLVHHPMPDPDDVDLCGDPDLKAEIDQALAAIRSQPKRRFRPHARGDGRSVGRDAGSGGRETGAGGRDAGADNSPAPKRRSWFRPR